MTNGFRLDVTNTELFFQYCIQHNKDDQQKRIVIKQLLDQLAEQPIEIQKLFYKYCLKIKQYQDLKDFIQSQETSYVNKAFNQEGRILVTFRFCILNNINKKHDILFIDQYQINQISKKNSNIKKLQITSCYIKINICNNQQLDKKQKKRETEDFIQNHLQDQRIQCQKCFEEQLSPVSTQGTFVLYNCSSINLYLCWNHLRKQPQFKKVDENLYQCKQPNERTKQFKLIQFYAKCNKMIDKKIEDHQFIECMMTVERASLDFKRQFNQNPQI